MSKKKVGIIAAIAAGVLLLGGAAVAVPLILKNSAKEPSEEPVESSEIVSSEEPTTEEVTYPEGITWYDVNDEVVEISTVQQFLDIGELSYYFDFEGQTLKLMNDLTLNEGDAADWGENRPEVAVKPIRNFAGTFDGQGHTISGMYISGGDMRLAMFSSAKDSAVIENLSVVNAYIRSNGSLGSATFTSNSKATLRRLYSNAIIEVAGGYVAGIASLPSGGEIEECWYDGTITSTTRYAGGIVDVVPGYATVSVRHCLNTSTINNSWTRNSSSIGGLVGCVQGYSTLNLEDSFSDGEFHFANYIRCGMVLGGDANNGTSTSNILNCFATNDSFGTAISGVATGTIGGAIAMKRAKLIGDGGWEWTQLDFDNYWTTVEDSTPRLICFSEKKGSYENLSKHYNTEWYDPEGTEFVITNLEELYGFAMLAFTTDFSGQTIKLGADIDMNEAPENYKSWANEAPDNPWIPVGNTAYRFNGVFDGDGHTLRGMYLDTGSYGGFFGVTSENSEVKNLKMTNAYFHSSGSATGILAGRGNGHFSNIYVDGDLVLDVGDQTANGVGGIIGQIQLGTAKIENCWFAGSLTVPGNGVQQCGGIVGHVTNTAGAEIRHCLNTGTITGKRNGGYNNLGGIIGFANDRCTLVVEDCLGVGKVDPQDNKGGCGSVIGHVGGNAEATIRNTYAVSESFGKALGTNRGIVDGGIEIQKTAAISGFKAFQWTELDFDQYWAVVPNGTPILQSFADDIPSTEGYAKLFDTSWYDPEGTSFVITTREQLYGFQKLSLSHTFEGQTISLGNSIAMNYGNVGSWANGAVPANVWLGIGDKTNPFKGTFDGRYCTVSGIYMNETDECKGFFNVTATPAVVKNLRINNSCYLSESGAIASVAGRGNGTFSNIYSNAYIRSTQTAAQGVGGIVGQVQENDANVSLSYCWFDGQVILTGSNAQQNGGIVGKQFYRSHLTISHCLFTGTIYDHRASGYCNIGGIIGLTGKTTASGVDYCPSLVIIDCLSDGKFDTNGGGCGSILGQAGADTAVTIRNSYGTRETKGATVGANNTKGAYSDNSATFQRDKILGTDAYVWTMLDFNSVWGCVQDSTPRLRAFTAASNFLSTADVTKVDTSWYDKNATEYTINTLSELLSLQVVASSETFKDKTIKLGADIVFNENYADYLTWGENPPANTWTPINSQSNPFQGTFDGQGHAIYGFCVNSGDAFSGLFTEARNATVKNLSMIDAYIVNKEGRAGIFVGRGGCSFENVYADGLIESTNSWNGGFIGQGTWTDSSFVNCEFAGTIRMKSESNRYVGGFMGSVNGNANQPINVTVNHCKFSGTIDVSRTTAGAADVGGIIGQIVNNAGAVCVLNVTDFLSAGTITASEGLTQVGSVIGAVGGAQKAVLNTTYAVKESAKVGETPVSGVGYVSGSLNGEVQEKGAEFLVGIRGYNNTLLDFDNYWAAVEEKDPQLKVFVSEEDKTIDTAGLERFDETWYDAAATEYHVTTVAQLLKLVEVSKGSKEEPAQNFSGKTIYIDNDLVFNEGHENFANWGTEAPSRAWRGFGTEAAKEVDSEDKKFQGTIDGQRHKIYGLYQKIASENSDQNDGLTGLVSQLGEYGVIKNLFIVNSYFENGVNQNNGSVAGFASGTIDTVYSNAKVVSSMSNAAGIVGNTTGALTMNKVWYAGDVDDTSTAPLVHAGGLLAYVGKDTSAVITDSMFTGTVKTNTEKKYYTGGFIGQVTGTNATAAIADSISAGYVTGYANYNGTFVGQKGNTASLTFSNVYVKENSSTNADKPLGTGTATGAATILTAEQLTGANAEANTSLNFKKTWITVEDSICEINDLSEFRVAPPTEPNTDWYDETASEYTLMTTNDLYGLAEILSTGEVMKGKTIKLGADIVLNEDHASFASWGTTPPEEEWIPMGPKEYATSAGNGFAGTFDGQGHSIVGLYSKQSAPMRGGLFTAIKNATIRNLKLTDCYFENAGSQRFGVFAGAGTGTFENVYTNAILNVTASANHVGGFVGQGWGLTFKNCWFDGEVRTVGGQGAASFIGTVTEVEAVSFENCLTSGKIVVNNGGAAANTGAFVGYIFNNVPNFTAKNCLAVCTIETAAGNSSVGSFFGKVENANGGKTFNITFENCYTLAGMVASNKTCILPTSPTFSISGAVNVVERSAVTGSAAQATLAGFDFSSVWSVSDGQTPVLKAFSE